MRGGGGAVSASIRRRRAGCLDRPPPAAPHRRCDGAPASPLRYWPARVRHVFRRHAEIKQAMGFRRFIFRGVTKVRDEWDLPCAALNLRRLRALGVAAA